MPESEPTNLLSVLSGRRARSGRRRPREAGIDLPISEAPAPGVVRRREGFNRRLLIGGDVVAALVAMVAVVQVGMGNQLRPLGVALALLSLVFVNKLSGLYDRDELVLNRSTLDELPRLLQISGLFAFVTWLLHRAFTSSLLHQTNVLALWVAVFFGLVAARVLARGCADRWTAPERCLVVGDGLIAQRIALKMRDGHVHAVVAASIAMDEHHPGGLIGQQRTFDRLIADFRIERVIIAQAQAESGPPLHIIRMAKAAGLRVSLVPRLLEVVGSSVEFDELDGLTVLGVRKFGLSRSSLVLKRSFDLFGATVGLLSVAPVFAVIAVAVKLDSRGSVFFRQTRIGQDGKPFEMIKFRSMVQGADALKSSLRHRNEAEGLFKIADDPRITRVGSFIRRTSLDELPQLLNVLRGEMSLVGPRPLVEEEDAMVLGFDRSRLHLTPGMTGHWQILGSARIPMNEMVAIDYLYVANWSLWNDIKILLRTVRHVCARGGM